MYILIRSYKCAMCSAAQYEYGEPDIVHLWCRWLASLVPAHMVSLVERGKEISLC